VGAGFGGMSVSLSERQRVCDVTGACGGGTIGREHAWCVDNHWNCLVGVVVTGEAGVWDVGGRA
jgi:hypothetical protein